MFTFNHWISQVNAMIFRRYGIGIRDLPDEDFQTYYDDKIKPSVMMKIIIENNKENIN